MNQTPRSAKDCQCPQDRVDRYVNRIAVWVFTPLATLFLLGQIARAAHVWPFN